MNCMAAAVALAVLAVAAPSRPPQEIILDLSGSMYAVTGKSTRISQARSVLKRVLQEAGGTPVAVRVYGHRSRTDCKDTELILPFSETAAPEALARLLKLEPKGQTPIEHVLRQAKADFAGKSGSILLITDGEESCHGDPCGYAPQLKAAGLRVDTVGFGIGEEEEGSLRCIAEATGGRYYSAFDEFSFAAAVAQSRLETVCQDCGKIEARWLTPTSALPVQGYRLLVAGTREPLTLYPLTNTVSAAPPGLYDLSLIPNTGDELVARDVQVETGKLVKASFAASKLGELEAWYTTPGGREIAVGYQAVDRTTREAHPIFLMTGKVHQLPAGRWDLILDHDGDIRKVPDLLIEPGRKAVVRFKTGGTGFVRAAYEPLVGLAAVTYSARDLDDDKVVLEGLAVNRKAELPAGTYDLTLVPQAGIALRLEKVKVKGGRTKKVVFSNGGFGAVKASYADPDGADPALPYAALKDGEPFRGSLLTNRPSLLPVGTYALRFQTPGGGVLTIDDVAIVEGKTVLARFR